MKKYTEEDVQKFASDNQDLMTDIYKIEQWESVRDIAAAEYGKSYASPFDYDVTKAFAKGFDAARTIKGDGFSETERMEYLQKTLVLSVQRTVANKKEVASVGSRLNELRSAMAAATLHLMDDDINSAKEVLVLAYAADQKAKENI